MPCDSSILLRFTATRSASTVSSRCSTNSSASNPPPPNPPYNIERTGENAYRISVAVAGFTSEDLSIEVKENTLTLKGEKKVSEERKGDVLYQGIAARSFERRFQLADGVQVTGAALENGLLHVDLVREIPEAKKPRRIPIAQGRQAPTIEAEVKKAA
jgi:molecular chaperone IbpA